MKNVYIPSSNPWYESIDGVLFGKLNHRLQVYPAGRTEKMYVVPEGTLGITGWAFADCAALEQVILPESVFALYIWAFMDCINLKSVYFTGNVPEIWSKGAFSNTSPKLTIYYPEGNTSGWTSPTWKAPDGITYKTAVYTPEELPSDNILGDLSGDGTIDNDDVLVLKKYFAGHAVSIDPTLADVDEDGTITRRDAMILARYVAEWEGYTLPYVTEKYPFEQTYWVIFTEGFREDRVEASTIDSPIAAENLYLVWDTALILSDRTGESTCKQYYLDEDNRWVFMSDYHLLTSNATNVIASNLDIYDADGNLILKKCDYRDIDWENVNSYK